MKRFLVLLSLVFLCKISICSKLKTEEYINLIVDVRDAYDPSSMLLTYFVDNDSK